MAPSKTQSQCSQQLAYLQCPLRRKPPSAAVALPAGMSDEQIRVEVSRPQTSCVARSSSSAMNQGCTPHAVDPRGRHVALGELELDVVERVEVHLVAAPPLPLQHAG